MVTSSFVAAEHRALEQSIPLRWRAAQLPREQDEGCVTKETGMDRACRARGIAVARKRCLRGHGGN